MENYTYFVDLYKRSKELLDQLPIELTPQPLDYTLNKLMPAINNVQHEATNSFMAMAATPHTLPDNKSAQGLNTIGMLTDRFTILLIREWCLRNKGNKNEAKADQLFNTQTTEIMKAMAEAKQGYSSLNSKVTNIKADAKADSWEAAYYGLLTTNLLLWESQEVLYIKDIQSLPVEEIRDYIKWFSFGNILRNEYIELCELRYWDSFIKTAQSL
jgi:hypothetical protein